LAQELARLELDESSERCGRTLLGLLSPREYPRVAMQVQMQQHQAQQPQQATLKVGAFREFAATLAGQVVEQLAQEFEREVNVMYADLWMYRTELERVAELLGHQVGREKQLHEMLQQMGDVHSTMVAQMEGLKRQEPDARVLHEMLDQMQNQSLSVVNSQLSGMSSAHMVAAANSQKSKELQEPMISAEMEFNRILQLLSQPLIPGNLPQPTMAMVPNSPSAPQISTPTVPQVGIAIGNGGWQAQQISPTPPIRQTPPVSPAQRAPSATPFGSGTHTQATSTPRQMAAPAAPYASSPMRQAAFA